MKPYKFSTIEGVVYTKKMTKNMNVYFVQDEETSFRLLAKNRVEMVITGLVSGLNFLNKSGFNDINPLHKPIDEKKLYHYLHKKHYDLAPLINQVLLDMKKAGRIQEIRELYIQSLKAK